MTAWECSPDFEPGYIRCTVKPLEHRGPRTPKGQPPSPRSPSVWPPWWLLLCDLNNYVCRALALKLFCGRKAVGTQPVSVCPSLAEDTVQARGALVKEWERGWERGVACLQDGLHSRGFRRTLAAEAKNVYQADLWSQTTFTFAAQRGCWQVGLEAEGGGEQRNTLPSERSSWTGGQSQNGRDTLRHADRLPSVFVRGRASEVWLWCCKRKMQFGHTPLKSLSERCHQGRSGL